MSDAADVCAICLEHVNVRGTLNCCTHPFCFECIAEWSKVTNLCPVCKRRFRSILRGDTGKSLRVRRREQRVDSRIFFEDDEAFARQLQAEEDAAMGVWAIAAAMVDSGAEDDDDEEDDDDYSDEGFIESDDEEEEDDEEASWEEGDSDSSVEEIPAPAPVPAQAMPRQRGSAMQVIDVDSSSDSDSDRREAPVQRRSRQARGAPRSKRARR